MKNLTIALLIALSISIFSGCASFQFGGGSETIEKEPTIGQQLIDLKKAKDTGVITEAEFQAEKAKLMKVK